MNGVNLNLFTDFFKKHSDNGRVYFSDYDKVEGFPVASSVKIIFNKIELTGWGIGESQKHSNFIAFMELYERLISHLYTPVFYKNGLFLSKKYNIQKLRSRYNNYSFWIGRGSNGCAVHTSKFQARKNAISELVERHTILKALACKITPIKISRDHFRDAIHPYKDSYRSVTSNAYFWRGALGQSIVMLQLSYKDKYMYFFGSAKNLKNACRKAYFEASPNYTILPIYMPKYKNINSRVNSEVIRNEHLFGKYERIMNLTSCHSNSSDSNLVDKDMTSKHIYVSDVEILNSSKYKINGIYFAKAISPLMQPLFFDYWDKSYINRLAIPEYDSNLIGDLHIVS